MIRVIAALVIVAALAGLWWHGYKRGEAADKARSDLVIERMVAKATEELAQANALIRQQTDALQATKERAERDLQTERARNERRLADARATSSLVREQLGSVSLAAALATKRSPQAFEDMIGLQRPLWIVTNPRLTSTLVDRNKVLCLINLMAIVEL